MTKIQALVASAALAIGMAAPVSAGVNDPEIIIYRFPGVIASNNTGTVFLCTNFSGVTETIRFVTRQTDTSILHNQTINVNHLATVAAATRGVAAYTIQLPLSPPNAVQGTTAIAATSTNIICTAMNIDPVNTATDGVALRGIRFSPVPGSQE